MANLNPLCDVCGEARACISDGTIGALICQNPECFEKAWDRAHDRANSPAPQQRDFQHGFIWSARHWSPMLSIAEHLGDRKSAKVLIEHGLYADHCGGYEVAAWPCPIAADTLNFIVEETP